GENDYRGDAPDQKPDISQHAAEAELKLLLALGLRGRARVAGHVVHGLNDSWHVLTAAGQNGEPPGLAGAAGKLVQIIPAKHQRRFVRGINRSEAPHNHEFQIHRIVRAHERDAVADLPTEALHQAHAGDRAVALFPKGLLLVLRQQKLRENDDRLLRIDRDLYEKIVLVDVDH